MIEGGGGGGCVGRAALLERFGPMEFDKVSRLFSNTAAKSSILSLSTSWC